MRCHRLCHPYPVHAVRYNLPNTPRGVPSPRLRPLPPFSALLSADPLLHLPPHLDLYLNPHSTVLDSLHLDALPPARLPLLVFVNKGIETGTNKLPLEVIEEACGKEVAHVSTFLVRLEWCALWWVFSLTRRRAVGPFIRQGDCQATTDAGLGLVHFDPTCSSNGRAVPSASLPVLVRCVGLISAPARSLTSRASSVNTDPIGVELAGALKNVYAIASGVSGGLGFEANTRAGAFGAIHDALDAR